MLYYEATDPLREPAWDAGAAVGEDLTPRAKAARLHEARGYYERPLAFKRRFRLCKAAARVRRRGSPCGAEGDVEARRGYRVTTPLRTILDIARSPRVSPEHLEAAVAEALERGLVRRKRLREALKTLEDEERRSIVEGAMSGVAR